MLNKIWVFLMQKVIPNIKWESLTALFKGGKYWSLTEEDWDVLRKLLKEDYFIILTRRNSHFTTYAIAILEWIKRGKLSHYSHALINIEGDDIKSDKDFILVEATSPGTHTSTFMQVFDCDSVCLLRPKHFSKEDWDKCVAKVISDIGKPYDIDGNLSDDSKLTCAELDRDGLKQVPDYIKEFPNFEAMAEKHKIAMPQMYYDSGDFEIVFEVRR